MTTTTTTTPT